MLRRWDLNAILTPDQISEAVRQLAAWPLRIVQVRALFADAWRLRKNLTFADATYVALAEHLSADLLTDDTSSPTLRRCLYQSCAYRSARETGRRRGQSPRTAHAGSTPDERPGTAFRSDKPEDWS